MNQHLIEARKVLQLIPVTQCYGMKKRWWKDHAKHIAFILQRIYKSEIAFNKACNLLKIENAPPFTLQFNFFKKGNKTTGEKWPELTEWLMKDLTLIDFGILPEMTEATKVTETKTPTNVTKYTAVQGLIVKSENIEQSSPEYRVLILEILDGKHSHLKITIENA